MQAPAPVCKKPAVAQAKGKAKPAGMIDSSSIELLSFEVGYSYMPEFLKLRLQPTMTTRTFFEIWRTCDLRGGYAAV